MSRVFVIYEKGGWCLIEQPNGEIVAGPCETTEELKRDYERRLYRIRQGWAP